MPRGKYVNHKGRGRRFTSAEELEEQRRKDLMQKKDKDNEEASSEEASSDGSGSESDSEGDGTPAKAKGVENLIEIENPNRAKPKSKKVTTTTEVVGRPELSRREREEIEKQRAAAHYNKLHAMGKTEEARADLARLAIIKQQREEAAKRREQERQEKEAAKLNKVAATQKALGKKS